MKKGVVFPDIDFFNGFKFSDSQKASWKKIDIDSENTTAFIYDPLFNSDYILKSTCFK